MWYIITQSVTEISQGFIKILYSVTRNKKSLQWVGPLSTDLLPRVGRFNKFRRSVVDVRYQVKWRIMDFTVNIILELKLCWPDCDVWNTKFANYSITLLVDFTFWVQHKRIAWLTGIPNPPAMLYQQYNYTLGDISVIIWNPCMYTSYKWCYREKRSAEEAVNICPNHLVSTNVCARFLFQL